MHPISWLHDFILLEFIHFCVCDMFKNKKSFKKLVLNICFIQKRIFSHNCKKLFNDKKKEIILKILLFF